MSQPHALIIEDNSKNAAVLGKLLTKQGVYLHSNFRP